MTYPPGNPGYPSAQTPGAYGAPAGQPASPLGAPGSAESKLPQILTAVVAGLGVLAYLASFGPMLKVGGSYANSFSASGTTLEIQLALVAGLLAGVGLLPKAKQYAPIVAVLSGVAALSLVSQVLTKGDGMTIGWGMWLALVLVLLQVIAAVVVLLLDAGVITAPAPRPSHSPYAPYGQYPPAVGGYYGQPVQQGQFGQPGSGEQQTVVHPSYPGSSGGYPAGSQFGQQQGTPTPPTGFPNYGSPLTGSTGSAGSDASGAEGQPPSGGSSSS